MANSLIVNTVLALGAGVTAAAMMLMALHQNILPAALRPPIPQAAPVRVVTVDAEALLEATLRKATANPEDAGPMAKAFATGLDAILARYADNGYVVINRSSVFTLPPENDITDVVAQSLGMDREAADDAKADH